MAAAAAKVEAGSAAKLLPLQASGSALPARSATGAEAEVASGALSIEFRGGVGLRGAIDARLLGVAIEALSRP